MADNDIKQKIILEGEQQYRNAIKEAQRNLKTLRSELKAETAELGKNATEQQKAETRAKSLQKQIAEQEKIVKANTEALEEVRQKYGDNADAVAKYEQKLNESRAALANMKNELESTGDGFKDLAKDADMATVAAKSVADTIGSLADVGDSIAGSIEGIFTGMLDTIRGAVQQVWGDIVAIAAKANSYGDLAKFWNTDTTTIQKYAGAVQEASGTLEDLNSIVTKINAKALSTEGNKKKGGGVLAGVSISKYEDEWAYAMAVMDALSEMETKERNKTAQEIFGKNFTKALDLVNDWKTVQDNLGKYDVEQGGYGLTKEEMQEMSDLYDKVNGLKASWESLKEMAEVHLFGDLAMNVTGNLQNIVDAFKEYFHAETDDKRSEALDKVKENVVNIFKKVVEGINEGIAMLEELAQSMQGSEDPTTQAIGNILGGIVEALKWFTRDHMRGVVEALELLADFWVIGKGFSLIGKVTEFASQIAILKGYGGVGALFGATGTLTATASVAESVSSSITAAITAAAGPFATAMAGVTMSVGIAALAVPVVSALKDIIAGKWPDWLPNPNARVGSLLLGAEAPEELKEAAEEVAKSGLGTMEGLTNPLGVTMLKLTGSRTEEEKTDRPTIPTKRTPRGNIMGYSVTEEQRAAMEAWWDIYRQDPVLGSLSEEAESFRAAFEGQEGIYEKLIDLVSWYEDHQNENDFYGMEDLPANWFNMDADENGVTSEDIQGLNALPQKTKEAVGELVGSINFYMDGELVADLIAPRVSEKIGSEIHE